MTVQAATIDLMAGTARVGGLAALAGGIATGVALVFRWYARERVPSGLAVLAGLASVAVYLNTTASLGLVIGGARGLLDLDAAIVNTATFLVAWAASLAGRRIGDRVAVEAGVVSGARTLDTDVSRLVQAVGRVITVTLPEADDIGDIEAYDPVAPGTKDDLGGKTLLFPRRLTVAELRDRLVTRIKDDYGVGHVDLDLADDGTVEYLAVGSRAAGLGPSLAPGTAATAVRADPAFSATSGDVVQVWTRGDDPVRVATGEFRGASDDVVTLALDEPDAEALDPAATYRLVTLPVQPRPEREFAALLRDADETMGVVTVEEGSPIVGTPIGALDLTVAAIRPAAGAVEAIPARDRVLAPGDAVYVVARPEALRRIEAASTAEAEPSL